MFSRTSGRRPRRVRRLATLALRALEDRCTPANLVVTSAADSGAGSLRAIITTANTNGEADTITFDPVAFATPQTISLTTGEIAISEPLILQGPDARLTIDAESTSRIFSIDLQVLTSVPSTISGLSLVHGKPTNGGNGGGIVDYRGPLILNDVIISSCTTTGGGGGLYISGGPLTMTDCQITNNQATGKGTAGGLYLYQTNTTILRCLIANNTAASTCGGINFTTAGFNNSLTIDDSAIIGNTASVLIVSMGGGINLREGLTTIRNTTISGNQAWIGGGIYTSGTVVMQNCTLAFNSATSAVGGLDVLPSGGTVTLESTIIAGNTSPTSGDVQGKIAADFSLIGNTSGATITGTNNKLNVDAKLAPLGNHGGATPTYTLVAGSPALDAGSNPAGLATDQRGAGFPRVINSLPDIGAAEGVYAIPIPILSVSTVTVGGSPTQIITVVYTDDVGIDVSTLGTGDITVSGLGGFTATPTFVGVDINSNGVYRVATYQFTPPGGAWDPTDNGAYTVSMSASQVFDVDVPTANPAAAGSIGTLSVAIPRTYLVDITTDEDDGNYGTGDLSLREAIKLANANSAVRDVVMFDPSVFATQQTISLTLGEMFISQPMAIIGPGPNGSPNLLTIDAQNSSRIFSIDVSQKYHQDVAISRMKLVNGNVATGSGGAISNKDEALTLANVDISTCTANSGGGAISVVAQEGSLSMTDCHLTMNRAFSGGAVTAFLSSTAIIRSTITGNTATFGGAISQQYGSLKIDDSSITSNSASVTSAAGLGGGIYAKFADVIIRNCDISNNSAFTTGGIWARSDQTFGGFVLESCLISGNHTNATSSFGLGGGVYWYGTSNPSFRNCTISGNSAFRGGGIALAASGLSHPEISNVTLAFNTATSSGGGLYVKTSTGMPTLTSTLLGNNSATTGPDLSGKATANFSLFSNTAGATITGANDKLNMDPMLAPLANNGGPTQTHALLPGSPCINVGSNPAGLSHDQRGPGYFRFAGPAADIGAFEVQAPPAKITSVIVNDGSAQRSRVTSLTITFDQNVGLPALPASAFQLKRQLDNSIVGLSVTVTGSAVTLTFTTGPVDFGSLADGRYTLTVLASNVSFGNFDGNADGTPGDDYVLVGSPTNGLFRLFGDSDGNGVIDGLDYGAFRMAFNTSNTTFSFDGTGPVDGVDFGQFRMRFGLVI